MVQRAFVYVCDPHLSTQLTALPLNDCYYPSYYSLTAPQWVAAQKQKEEVKERGMDCNSARTAAGNSHFSFSGTFTLKWS